MTRSKMRGAAVLAVPVAALVLAGCGAGQVTQTEGMQPPVSGVNAQSTDGKIILRNVSLEYPGPGGYKTGEAVPVQVRIANQYLNPVRLVQVSSDAGVVTVAGPATAVSSPPSPSVAASSEPSTAPSPSVSTAPAPPANTQINIEIPTRGLAVLDPGGQRFLQITGLRKEIRPGQNVELTFRFDNGVTITTPVPVAVPLSPPPRSPMEFDGEHE